MLRHLLRTAACLALLLGAGTAAAQQGTPEAVPGTTGPAMSLPPAVSLTGLQPVYQLVNRCSAAALTIQLSYFDWEGNYTTAINGLNTNEQDVAVRLDEMVTFVRQWGFDAVERVGGTVDTLKALVAGGFPVLIENSYFEGPGGYDAWLGHNRVVMGYDDAQGVLLTFDSLLGNGPDNTGRPIPYEEMDERWRPFNRDYLVVFRPEQAEQVAQILGEDWDPEANHRRALAISQAEIGTPLEDGFTWFNVGSSMVALGDFESAAEAYDRAFEIGLPWRMLWYQYGPFQAYMAVGRYEDVITRAQSVISMIGGVEESYYYMGLAHEAIGDLSRARRYLEIAVYGNRNFTIAADALARVDAAVAAAAGTG
jgi:tetratricopeptide (TPR) repeat protein